MVQEEQVFETVGDVAGVAVEEQECGDRLFGRNEPAVQFDAVTRLEPDILNRERHVGRVPQPVRIFGGMIDDIVFATDQQEG